MSNCDCSECEKIDCKLNPNYFDYVLSQYGNGCCLKERDNNEY